MKISKNILVTVAIAVATLSSILTINTKSANAYSIDQVDPALSTVSYNSCGDHGKEVKEGDKPTSTTQK